MRRPASPSTWTPRAASCPSTRRPRTGSTCSASQAYGPRTGVYRLLRVLERQQVRATFFVPGWVAERWPDAVRAIRDAGHEIGHHGYFHEGSRGVAAPELERRLLRGFEALDAVAGVRPTGYRAPMWEFSAEMPAILARHGIRYEVGPGRGRALPAGLRGGEWHDPEGEWHCLPRGTPRPVGAGRLGGLRVPAGHHGQRLDRPPLKLSDRWTDELDSLTAEGGLFMLTNHPFLSGRA